MKKIYLSLLSIVFAINFSYAQTNTFPTSGNAGIGTTSPIDPFQISGSSAVNKAEMSITNTDAGGNTWRIGDAIGATAGIFTIYNVNNSVLPFVINGNTGNIGVGIAYPLNKLHVYSASSADGISIDGNTNPAMVLRSSGVIKGYAPGIVTTNGAFFSGSSVGDMIFRSESNKILFGINGNASTMAISGNNVGIGTTNPDQLLTVKGIIHSQEVIVDMSVLPDYVFKPAYHLPTLTEVKTYIDQNHHLPEMPSAEQVAKDGLSLGDMNAKLLKKVEELTLYLIEKDRQLKEQQIELVKQKQDNEKLESRIAKLEQMINAN